jgi:PAS domain S-box-containing protein
MQEIKNVEDSIRNIIKKHSLLLICKMDLFGKVKFVSNSIFEVTGYTKEEVIGNNFWQIFYPDDLKSQIDLLYEKFKKKDVEFYETRLKCKNGEIKTIAWSSMNKWSKEGKILEINLAGISLSGCSDIIESLKIYQELVESSNSIVLKMDSNGRVTFFNKFSEDFFGYKREEIIGKNIVGTIIPEKESSDRDLREMILDIGKMPQLYRNNVNENITKDGRRVWVSWTNRPIYNKQGEVKEILCIGNDITEVRKMQNELQREKNFMELIYNTVKNIILVLDLEGKVIFVNRAIEELTGFKREEVIGKNWLENFIPERIRKGLQEYFEKLKQNKVLFSEKTHESPILTKNNGERIILWNNSCLMEDGKISAILSAGQDITESKKLQEVLLEREKLTLMGEIAAGVAHEMRNPFAIMVQGVDYLKNVIIATRSFTLSKKGERMDVVQKMKDAINRADSLLRDLLDLSRAHKIEFQDVNLSDIIHRVADVVGYNLRKKNITLELNVPEELKMKLDPIRIEQLLINLLQNAIDAITSYGKIEISVVKIEARNMVEIKIKDNGKGIMKEDMKNIFEPFYTTREKKGLGLGLTICKMISEAHKGKIFVSSEWGKGTEIRILLPIKKEEGDDKSTSNR